MRVRATDPATSAEAAGDSAARQSIRMALLAVYAEDVLSHGEGLTDEEAMLAAGFDLADDGHRRRCSDLRDAGLIAPVRRDGRDLTRHSHRTGRRRMVCTITEAGIEALRRQMPV